MYSTHSLLDCPLYNSASLIINAENRIVLRATKELIHLLDNQDPTGTNWPTKEDQHLCFTTLIYNNNNNIKQQPKRLLTCEHINENTDQKLLSTTTTIFCADISFLETLYLNRNLLKMMHQSDNNIILRLNPYGIIQSVFSPCQSYKYMSGQPLMKYVLNEDIPILCKGLRQVTQYHHQDLYHDTTSTIAINNHNKKNTMKQNDDDDDDDDEFTIVTFDVRCQLSPTLFNEKDETIDFPSNIELDQKKKDDDDDNEEEEEEDDDDDDDDGDEEEKQDDNFRKHSIYYHFSTIVTSTQEIICVMRPSDKYNHQPHHSTTMNYSTTTSSTTTCFTSTLSHKISPLFQSTKVKLKSILHKLQQALWDAVEKGFLIVAHYLATVIVLAIQCYRLSKHPSFWLETSELALRCLVAETKSRPELNKLFSWLEWSGLQAPRKLFGFALDHGSEFFINLALRPRINTFL